MVLVAPFARYVKIELLTQPDSSSRLTIIINIHLHRGQPLQIVFRRRMEFHVTNTFLQTFLLISVGYLSFFFEITNFTDRIMVALTTMLVIATISTASQGVRKKIDIRQVMFITCYQKSLFCSMHLYFRDCLKQLTTRQSTIGFSSR